MESLNLCQQAPPSIGFLRDPDVWLSDHVTSVLFLLGGTEPTEFTQRLHANVRCLCLQPLQSTTPTDLVSYAELEDVFMVIW